MSTRLSVSWPELLALSLLSDGLHAITQRCASTHTLRTASNHRGAERQEHCPALATQAEVYHRHNLKKPNG